MTIEFTENIERVLVEIGGKRTTVSIDGVLYQVMALKLGGIDQVSPWIKGQAHIIGLRPDFTEKKSTIGLSRLIQQQAFLMISGANI